MNANDECEKCREKRERAEYLQRIDFWAAQVAWEELVYHKTQCHIWHVAIPTPPKLTVDNRK